ncbi:MAG: peptidase S10 [Truepera sp.]|jgi:carboxypeptidase C (cathepsin A)|nr:peptidase S10 [Truepera sp.]
MSTEPTPPEPPKLIPDELVTTEHEVVIGGGSVRYRATSGLVSLNREAVEDGVSKGVRTVARLFVTAYTRQDVENAAERPITFAYNGGPGSSSVWLHLGTFGPRRVVMGEEGEPLPAPYRLADNEWSLLDVTDLVFIDPVSTGWSRPAEGGKAKDFHGYQQDLESVGDLIREWLGREGRWLSPKFLAGESYGTTRSAGLSGYLQNRHGIFLAGIMLLSSVLDFSTLHFNVGNDLPPLVYLPSYAATAWYHGRLRAELQAKPLLELLREVEEFALERYSLALLKGDRLAPAERADIARQVAAYTGTTPEFVERNNLRIALPRFTKELLRSERQTVGRLDSRYLGLDRDAGGDAFEYDPSLPAIQEPFTAAWNAYVRTELGFRLTPDVTYEILTSLYSSWDYSDFTGKYVNVADTLRHAMSVNRHLRVHVASAYYDLATPYFATEHTLSHLGLEEGLRENITTSTYESGHMMYVRLEDLARLKEALATFIEG